MSECPKCHGKGVVRLPRCWICFALLSDQEIPESSDAEFRSVYESQYQGKALSCGCPAYMVKIDLRCPVCKGEKYV